MFGKEKTMFSRNKYIVSYDLRGFDKDYDELIDGLKQYNKCLKINNSCWLIETAFGAKEVRDQLSDFLDADDSIFVASLTGEAAWKNADSKNDEIKSVLTKKP